MQLKSRGAVRIARQAGNADPAQLGRSLGVDYLVEGSIRHVGDRLRIAIRLIKTVVRLRMRCASSHADLSPSFFIFCENTVTNAVNRDYAQPVYAALDGPFAEWEETGAWWTRKYLGPFSPPVSK